MENNLKFNMRQIALGRDIRKIELPKKHDGSPKRISEYYEELIFDYRSSPLISNELKQEIIYNYQNHIPLKKEHAKAVADAVTTWATSRGATHFCHWFQPLTGSTAEKHDSFLDFAGYTPIERLSPNSLMKGEPDASSFPHGGTRATFEARGYTAWDLTSPMFLMEAANGLTLCIPTGFISYNGDVLDVKTPLLRSIDALGLQVKELLQLIEGDKGVKEIFVTCGAEQEYFLVDKVYFNARPDLVMCGRTLIGKNSHKDQQLSDHYFGTIPARVLAFMQELDLELHRLGIPAKTRHNEVAPGQFEVAPQFTDANLAADHNHLIMIKLREIADRHHFVALLHEKPFKNVNGSGKHLNWSLGDNLGRNLLDPGHHPQQNLIFLTLVSAITEAVYRHGGMLRLSTASFSNDFRLGGHEAPPSILSVFLGEVLTNIFDSIASKKELSQHSSDFIDVGVKKLAALSKDNSDRNRTSPFAFTGNRFEFRAVGSSQSIGLPLSFMNGAIADILQQFCKSLKDLLAKKLSIEEALKQVIGESFNRARPIVQNGDGYDQAWIEEAKRRGLPNYRHTIEVLSILKDPQQTAFLVNQKILKEHEVAMRYNVFHERYRQLALIELNTLLKLVNQYVIPNCVQYKDQLLSVVSKQRVIKLDDTCEEEILKKLSAQLNALYQSSQNLEHYLRELSPVAEVANQELVKTLFPVAKEIRAVCDHLEAMIPESLWELPRYYELFFMR